MHGDVMKHIMAYW